ncbi:MAG TPA: hypothetical protein VHN39_17350, partial [Phenylobacterium sp.]|nr:hypothetical protein [Phenylobacterium sp.]
MAALSAGHASAADAADAVSASGGGAQVEELVVTAQKREEKLQDVPMSVNAISGAQLAAKGITQVADL